MGHPVTYYHLPTNTVDRLPDAARRVDTGQWVLALRSADVATQQACGWYKVAETAPPDDTATDTFDRSVQLIAGVPTVVWTQRPKTPTELDGAKSAATQTTLEGNARNAYTANRNFLAVASPTNAQVVAQVRALTRQQNAVIRLLVARDLLTDPVVD